MGLLLAAATVAVERRRHQRAEARLHRAAAEREAERERLSAQVVTAEQDERRRLSVVLHDGPLQSLSGIVLIHDAALAALREGKADDAARLLDGALERERETIQTLRDLSFAMEPVILRDQGFDAAARALAEQLERARRIEISLDVSAADRLGEKAQVALYQTLREALAQAARRRPRQITIAVSELPDGGYEASIEDDGVEERRRANLEAIEERARLLNGKVAVSAAGKGAGTAVLVSIPSYVAARRSRLG